MQRYDSRWRNGRVCLGSILGSMQKPPTVADAEKKKAQAQQKQLEKIQQQEKEKLNKFRQKVQKTINDFLKDSNKQKYKFEPMPKVYRAIVHEVADVAGLTSFSFGEEEVDRYVLLWKKEFAPSDDELAAYRRGEEWSEEKAKELSKQKELDKLAADEATSKPDKVIPASNYKDKYERLIGRVAAKDAAQATTANTSYGFVPSENKRDQRTIEEVMKDQRAKRLKTQHDDSATAD